MKDNVPKKRVCIKEKEFNCLSGKTKQIHVPIEQEEYKQILYDPEAFRNCIDKLLKSHPEIFPVEIERGYNLEHRQEK